MKFSLKYILFIFGTVIIIVFGYTFSALKDYFRGYYEVTSYPVGSYDGKTFDMPLNRTTYRLFPEEKTATYWLPDFNIPPRELVNCVIVDRCNWECSYPDGSGQVGMGNCLMPWNDIGESFETHTVPKAEWWSYRKN